MRSCFLRSTTYPGPWLAMILFLLFPSLLFAQDSGGESGGDGETESAGILQFILAGGPLGILIFLVLLALSLTAVYLVFDHLINVRRKDVLPEGLGEEIRAHLKAGRVAEAEDLCRSNPSMLSFVMLHGITELEFGWSSVEKALEDALAEQSARMLRKIEYLSVIGNLAPMVGLLGTVVGLMLAFLAVAVGGGTAGPVELALGIYLALGTTVMGLIVAIPSLGAFAVFRNRVDQMVAEAAYTAQHVFAPLRRKGKTRTTSAPAAK